MDSPRLQLVLLLNLSVTPRSVVSVSQLGCVYDLSITGDLCVLSPSDKSPQGPREQRDWLRGQHTRGEAGGGCINRVVTYVSAGFAAN